MLALRLVRLRVCVGLITCALLVFGGYVLAGVGTGGVVFVVLCGLVGFCLCDVVDVFVLCCWSCFRQVWLAVVYFWVEFSVLVCVKCSIRNLVGVLTLITGMFM